MVCTHTGLNKPKYQKVKERQRRKKKRAKDTATKAASKRSKQERGARNHSRGVRRIEIITYAN